MNRKYFIAPFLLLIFIYRRVISPLLPPACRHLPTCSEYAAEALNQHGLIKGGRLAVNRISRCHPWGTSGFDPVPKIIPGKIKMHMPGLSPFKRFPYSNLLKHRH
jgi:hypothetical protein